MNSKEGQSYVYQFSCVSVLLCNLNHTPSAWDWNKMSQVHNGNGTQWARYTVRLGQNGPGIQWDTVGLEYDGTGAKWAWYIGNGTRTQWV